MSCGERHAALFELRRAVLGEDRPSRSKRESEGDPEGSSRMNDAKLGKHRSAIWSVQKPRLVNYAGYFGPYAITRLASVTSRYPF